MLTTTRVVRTNQTTEVEVDDKISDFKLRSHKAILGVSYLEYIGIFIIFTSFSIA